MPINLASIKKKYFSIGEVSKIFNVSPSLIRFWEDEFDIIKPKKSKKGHRMFTKEDIEDIRIVYHLVKEKGYTLNGAREALQGNRKTIEKSMKTIEKLKEIRNFLVDLKEQL